MNNTYYIKHKSLKETLDAADRVKDSLGVFSKKHPNYKYNIKINNLENEYELEFNINSDEDDKTNSSEETA